MALAALSAVGLLFAPAAFAQDDGQPTDGPIGDEETTTTTGGPRSGFFGTLRFEGEPVPGVEIVVAQDGDEVTRAVSDESGRWEAIVPEPGTYELTILTETLPQDVGLRDPDRETLTLEARAGRTRGALFALGEPRARGRPTLDRLADLAVSGLQLGSIIALSSLGLSLVFGITGLVNFSHGELLTFGALVAWLFNASGAGPGTSLIAAGLLAVLLGAVFGAAQDLGLWRPLRDRRAGRIAMLVVSIGLSIALRNVFLMFFGGQSRPYRDYAVQSTLSFGPVNVLPKEVFVMVTSLVILVVVGVVLLKTRIGTAIRAVADTTDLAEASGINVRRVILLIWTVGGALTALGGVFQGMVQNVSVEMGFRLLLLMFAGVILGGLGTAFGAMVGGLLLGIMVETSTIVVSSEFKEAVALGVMILFLLFRPQGLMGRAERVG